MLSYLRGTSKVFKWISKYPRTFALTGVLLGSPVINRLLNIKGHYQRNTSVYKKLVKGSCPNIPLTLAIEPVSRPDIATELTELFFQSNDVANRFGVIIGPSGSGKTTAISELCNKSPNGVLYHEVTNPVGFAEWLSREIGLHTAPSTVLDLILGYASDKYTHYVQLPECEFKALNEVFEILKNASIKYKKNMGRIPVLVIDGIDVLAKHNEELCCQLITTAKILANRKMINIILVSSEGSVILLLNKLSAINRSVICEVADIGDDKAREFLMRHGFDVTLAKKIVDCVGGRMIYLESCVFYIKSRKEMSQGPEMIFEERFFVRVLNHQKAIVASESPESVTLLQKVSRMGSLDVAEVFESFDNKERYQEVLVKMIGGNIFRYDSTGCVKFHGKPQENQFRMTTNSEI